MQSAAAVFLITLGIGQLMATRWQLRGASLVGPAPWSGYSTGAGLFIIGALILPAATPYALFWVPPAGLLALLLLLLAGSYVAPPPHPNILFTPENRAHDSCRSVQIPDGDDLMPGLLLTPPRDQDTTEKRCKAGTAVCIVPGAGDTKTSFKWRLIKALLAEGFTVLSIDPHGHGDYRHRPLVYPDCLSAIPAAIRFLRAQPAIQQIGLIGISLGGAISAKSLAEQVKTEANLVEAFVILETPIRLNYSKALFYHELWQTIYRAPVLSLLRETTIKQLRTSWNTGGYRSHHSLAELLTLLNPPGSLSNLKNMPILLVYSRRDKIAPPDHAQAMQKAAPQAFFIESKKASHVTLTLIPEVNKQIARWLREQLGNS